MLIILVISLLTLALISSIFLASYMRLWRNPPAIYVSLIVPDEFKLISQKLPSNIETDKPTEEPIPQDILEYISLESELSAQDARKRRARELYRDSQNWTIVFALMQREDTPVT